jgi:hypothetical protein
VPVAEVQADPVFQGCIGWLCVSVLSVGMLVVVWYEVCSLCS